VRQFITLETDTLGTLNEVQGVSEMGLNEQTIVPKQDDDSETQTGVSIIIPSLNEGENITMIVDRCLSALSDDFQVEIIVIDDDSPDLTWRIAAREYSTSPHVRVIRRTSRQDLATAILAGFWAASHEYCAVLDADLQHPPEKLTELLTPLTHDADIVIGSRYTDQGTIENWSPLRKLVSKGATITANICVPETRSISDPMSGFFAVRRRIVTESTLRPEGYKLLLDILTHCTYDTVVEIPYVFDNRKHGESNLTLTEYSTFVKHTLLLGLLRFTSLFSSNDCSLSNHDDPPQKYDALSVQQRSESVSQSSSQRQEDPHHND
jgi:dolichol-phosphate mannosyltransferase